MTERWQAEQLTAFDADYHGAMGGIFNLGDDAKRIVGEPTPGDTFIYLFRRFGYPRFGWDGHKELVSYRITTPMAGVLLTVRPNVTGGGIFGYMLREDIDRACEDEERKPYENWFRRCEAWAWEKHDIEIVRVFEQDNAKLKRVFDKWGANKEDSDFKDQDDVNRTFYDDQATIQIECQDRYTKIEQRPRLIQPEDREDNSIMKQCYTALCDTIRDLLRPVYVRDVMINVCGEVHWDATTNQDEDAVKYAAMAGCGAESTPRKTSREQEMI